LVAGLLAGSRLDRVDDPAAQALPSKSSAVVGATAWQHPNNRDDELTAVALEADAPAADTEAIFAA
jgi:hypothetical protein